MSFDQNLFRRLNIKSAIKRERRIELVGEFENTERAIEYTEKLKLHIILIDVKLGFKLAKTINKTFRDRIKIIFLTTDNSIKDLLEVFNIGFNAYLKTPIHPPENDYIHIWSLRG